MTEPALCQCTRCYRYLTTSRVLGSEYAWDHQCIECYPGQEPYKPHGIPLAKVRAALTDPLDVEVTALLNEECAEVVQRVSKIQRWGWDADFEGTTQADKLHTELGDVLAAIVVAVENGVVDLDSIVTCANTKLQKFREDAAGPRQRLMVAKAPDVEIVFLTPPVDTKP